MPLLLEPDKLESIDRVLKAIKSIDGPLKPLKTTQQIWRKVHSFEGYARDMPEMALNLLRLLSDINLGRRWIPHKKGQKLYRMVPNDGQLLLWNAMIEQAFDQLPIRVIVPKARRQGVSTAIDVTIDHLCFHYRDRKALIVAHETSSASAIFETVLQSHAKYLSQFKNQHVSWQSLPKTKIDYEATGSVFRVGTAMGRFKGSGGTLSYLHISELAKYDQTSGQDKKAMRSLLNSVTKDDPATIIAIESTGQGPTGEFYRRVKAAFSDSRVDDEADHDDETETNFRGVFLPWTLDKMCVSKSKKIPKAFDKFKPKPDGYELRLIKEFNVTPTQLMWRREELKEEGFTNYSENPAEWAWEWPNEWTDCFRGKSGLVYPMMVKKHPKCQIIPDEYFSPESYHSHAIDWGQSENSPFVCLWCRIDPTKEPALIVSPECVGVWDEFLSYSYDERTNEPRKEKDHSMDCIRYHVGTNKTRGLMYVYRELFVKSFGEDSGVGMLAKQIHEAQGWVSKSGYDGGKINLYDYHPGPGAVKEFEKGVMDRAAGLAIIGEFCKWGIPVRGYEAPTKGDTGKNARSAGIAMVGALCSGNLILEEPEDMSEQKLAAAAVSNLNALRPVEPSAAEWSAYHAVHGGDPEDAEEELSAGWY